MVVILLANRVVAGKTGRLACFGSLGNKRGKFIAMHDARLQPEFRG